MKFKQISRFIIYILSIISYFMWHKYIIQTPKWRCSKCSNEVKQNKRKRYLSLSCIPSSKSSSKLQDDQLQSFNFRYPTHIAAAPEMISISSLVMTACLVLLKVRVSLPIISPAIWPSVFRKHYTNQVKIKRNQCENLPWLQEKYAPAAISFPNIDFVHSEKRTS